MANQAKIEGIKAHEDGSGCPALGSYKGIAFACHTAGGRTRLTRIDQGRRSRLEIKIAIDQVTRAYAAARAELVDAAWMAKNVAMYPELAAEVFA